MTIENAFRTFEYEKQGPSGKSKRVISSANFIKLHA